MIDKIVVYCGDNNRRTFVMLAFALLLIICISTKTIVNSLPTVNDDDHLDDELDQLNEDMGDDEVERAFSNEKKSVEEEIEKTGSPHSNQCRYLGLVHCFTESLDDWALHLWNFRENIATLDHNSCEKRKIMDYCINYPGCTRQEIVNASRSVTDLLLHRRHTGTFLKSYFYSEFPCSSQGRMIVGQTQNCLVHARISQKAAWLSNYVERQIYARLKRNVPTGSEHYEIWNAPLNDEDKQWLCDFLREKANELRHVVDEECQEKAAYLMCKSFAGAFLNIFPRELENCHVDCPLTAPLETPPPASDEKALVDGGGERQAQEATNMGAQRSGGKTTLRRTGDSFAVLVYLFTASSLAARLIT